MYQAKSPRRRGCRRGTGRTGRCATARTESRSEPPHPSAGRPGPDSGHSAPRRPAWSTCIAVSWSSPLIAHSLDGTLSAKKIKGDYIQDNPSPIPTCSTGSCDSPSLPKGQRSGGGEEGQGDLGVRFDPSTGLGHRRLNELRDGKVHEMQGGENSRTILFYSSQIEYKMLPHPFRSFAGSGTREDSRQREGYTEVRPGGVRLDHLQGGRYVTWTLHRGGERQSRRGS